MQASARAQISLRVPPGVDAAEAMKLLAAHLERHVPWGARARVEQIGEGQPFSADTSSPAYQAMAEAMAAAYPGEQMQEAGQGGSIPLTNTLGSLYPEAEILLIGLSEPEAQIHAPNESVSPEELERLAVTEAVLPPELRPDGHRRLTGPQPGRARPGTSGRRSALARLCPAGPASMSGHVDIAAAHDRRHGAAREAVAVLDDRG